MKPLIDIGLPFARLLEPELAHRLAIRALGLMPLLPAGDDDPALAVEAFGLRFPNPVGLAAGFDKDVEVPDQALKLGFGFVEVGTLTPRAQSGNPTPRIFRLPADDGLINRLGFNNKGFGAGRARLMARTARGVVGVNVGANRDSVRQVADYVTGVETFASAANYLVVNASSPNTPGLRDLQERDKLDDLLARVIEARDYAAATAGRRPLLLKIAPDLTLRQLDDIVAVARARKLDGLIVSNTTLSRPESLRSQAAHEEGGLSGRPLFALSTRMLAETYVRVEGAFPLIGVGGIDSAEAAWEKIRVGATLVQLYTGLIYKGFGLVEEIKTGLVELLKRDAHGSLANVVGDKAASLVAAPRV